MNRPFLFFCRLSFAANMRERQMGNHQKQEMKCDSLQTSLQEKVAAHTRSVVEYTVGGCVVLAGQPQPIDMAALARQGMRTVINLRRDPERSAREAANAVAAGLEYIHLPLPAYELEAGHLAEFEKTIAGKEGLYIHCRSGSRVALLWMLHRMINQGWSRQAAEAELRAAGYNEESMEVFAYCTDDYLERTAAPASAG
jgi:uncharacterized protein (TIGR01244 family)